MDAFLRAKASALIPGRKTEDNALYDRQVTIMKKLTTIFILLFLFAMTLPATAASVINQDGYYKGFRMSGRVRIVESFPDIRVQKVHSFPDLRVKVVNSFPNNIGEWMFVDSFEDFTIQFVDSFPDIRVQFVTSFPGVDMN
ncbi:hypothetical protein TAMA11512_22770 [Selenomonas sp. TAMA-11512]|nr:hypothetical protein TAMA11512_22770 [Selenomonas sp. TAMA-11512]